MGRNRMRVNCPACGHQFEVVFSHKKGEGAHYSSQITKLSPMHHHILNVLKQSGAVSVDTAIPKRLIGAKLAESNIRVSGNVISGRLSELLGMGYVGMARRRIELYDRATMKFRFRKTPIWYLQG